MIGSTALNEVFANVLKTGLVKEIFHSVIIREATPQTLKPSAPVGGEFVYVGIDDRKGFTAYCRALGPMESLSEEKVSSCGPSLIKTRIPHRLVFFNPLEMRNHDDLAAILFRAVIVSPKTKFNRLIVNWSDFLRQEQPSGTFKLMTSDFYIAIDFTIQVEFPPNNCQQEINCGTANPYCG